MHLHASPESAQAFYQQHRDAGPVVMLNLLRYRPEADYSDAPELSTGDTPSGQAAYNTYMKAVAPIIAEAGGELLYFGKADRFLIGPVDEHWDAVLLVRYPSAKAFVGMAQSEAYRKVAGHRTAALQDSRLLPSSPLRVESGEK